MKNQIAGRQIEITTLNRIFNSQEAEFAAVYGRRRVGKTFLIRQLYKTYK